MKAVNYVRDINKKSVIFTDNISSLSLISQYNPPSYKNLTQEIHKTLLSLPTELVKMHWVPGHSQIYGNEQADAEAKKGAQSNIPPMIYPADFLEIKTAITRATKSHWRTKMGN